MMSEIEDLRAATASLNTTVTSLQVTVAELKTTLNWYVVRDREDRAAAANLDSRVSGLEKWQARIKGQIALLYFLIGGIGGALVARIAGLF